MMNGINDFLRNQPDEGEYLYGLMGTIGMGLMLLAVVFYLVRMKPKFVDILKVLVTAVITYLFMVHTHGLLLWYQKYLVGDVNHAPAGNLAVAFTLLPVVAWLCAKTFNTSTGFAGDVVALTALGYHVTGRAGCLFTGCCYGFPCEWGWYSHEAYNDAVHNAINNNLPLPQTDAVLYHRFPTALVESLFTLAIFAFVIWRICRKGYTPDGKNLPYFLLLYGVCRFFSEITRESTAKHWIFWRISDIHVHMLLMAAVGGFLLWRIYKKEHAPAVEEKPSLATLKGCRK